MPLLAQAGILGGATVILVLIYHFFTKAVPRTPIPNVQRSKSERAEQMKNTFHRIENEGLLSNERANMEAGEDRKESTMEVTQLWVYPIKSLRGCRVTSATMTRQGLQMDRKFMLLHVQEENPRKLKNMAVPVYPAMCLFHCSMEEDKIVVAYRAPGVAETASPTSEIDISLQPPAFQNLKKTVYVDMHNSPTTAYEMGDRYNEWFSEQFGFKVILVYYGGNTRQVLGNLPGKPASEAPKPRTAVSRIIGNLPILGPILNPDDEVIAFSDCAPYLVLTEESRDDVSSRLPEGIDMDITKFRGNIVLKGSPKAFDEDFWGELCLADGTRIILTANCGRCVSLNVDYETGEAGKGPTGGVLKLLTKDRRVDPGVKYSPIFGRYGFLSKPSEGKVLSVGDKVVVSTRLDATTKFYWPGLGTP